MSIEYCIYSIRATFKNTKQNQLTFSTWICWNSTCPAELEQLKRLLSIKSKRHSSYRCISHGREANIHTKLRIVAIDGMKVMRQLFKMIVQLQL